MYNDHVTARLTLELLSPWLKLWSTQVCNYLGSIFTTRQRSLSICSYKSHTFHQACDIQLPRPILRRTLNGEAAPAQCYQKGYNPDTRDSQDYSPSPMPPHCVSWKEIIPDYVEPTPAEVQSESQESAGLFPRTEKNLRVMKNLEAGRSPNSGSQSTSNSQSSQVLVESQPRCNSQPSHWQVERSYYGDSQPMDVDVDTSNQPMELDLNWGMPSSGDVSSSAASDFASSSSSGNNTASGGEKKKGKKKKLGGRKKAKNDGKATSGNQVSPDRGPAALRCPVCQTQYTTMPSLIRHRSNVFDRQCLDTDLKSVMTYFCVRSGTTECPYGYRSSNLASVQRHQSCLHDMELRADVREKLYYREELVTIKTGNGVIAVPW